MSENDVILRGKEVSKEKLTCESMCLSRPVTWSDNKTLSNEMINLQPLTSSTHQLREACENKKLRSKSYGPYVQTKYSMLFYMCMFYVCFKNGFQLSREAMEKQVLAVVPIDHAGRLSIPTPSDGIVFDRYDRHLGRLNTQLLEAIEHRDVEKAERLIIGGANPNVTCHIRRYSACHIAALVGGTFLEILVKYGADIHRIDYLGITPLHYAAWAGNAKQIAILLGLPEEIQHKIDNDLISMDTEVMIRKLKRNTAHLANVKRNIGAIEVLAQTWKESMEHKCWDFELPSVEELWTPLHAASSNARHICVRLLLAAGADFNAQDILGQRPLDVAGSAFYKRQKICKEYFRETIYILLEAGSKFHKPDQTVNNINLSIHTTVEFEDLELAETIIDAGASIKYLNVAGETILHICVRKQLAGIQMFSKYYKNGISPFDIVDRNGFSVLHAAIKAGWIRGVYIALENGADITVKAKNGQSPIHAAADLGNIDILNEILNIAEKKQLLNYKNKEGETALFRAIIHGHLDCVELILKKGASVHIKLPGDFNILHIAAQYGNSEILNVLLKDDDVINSEMINEQTNVLHEGLGPIHLAVINNRPECVKLLLNNKADVYLKALKVYMPYNAATPLHMAAVRNHLEVVKIIHNYDKRTVHEPDPYYKWTPLHAASYYGNRDIVLFLLREGADMTLQTQGPDKFKETSVNLIVNNISKPTQFLEDVFDSYIYGNDMLHSPNYLVTIDYRILMWNGEEDEQMKVVEALIDTGNRFGQKKLLLHPLVESFLYLNWMYLLPFFYIIIGLYGLYVMSFNIFITSIFFYQDTKTVTPVWLNPLGWSVVVFITGIIIFTQEIIYMNTRSRRYFNRLESWIKLSAVVFTIVLQPVLILFPQYLWPRHVATFALLLSWMEMLFMISRFPNWGYYVWMFGKVSTKVFKILLTFIFLLIGFALSFMVQFHSHAPFEDPWAAFVKTLVMMTSEFDYRDLFEEKQVKDETSNFILRIIFIFFLILAGIVLINLMVSVAVNDLHNLEVHGQVRRLEKQVEILAFLEAIIYNKALIQYLPKCFRSKRKPFTNITLSAFDCKSLPLYLRNAIFEKRLVKINKRDDIANSELLKNKIDEIHKVCLEKKNYINNPGIDAIRNETLNGNNKVNNPLDNDNIVGKDIVAELKKRMENMSIEMESINSLIRKLENNVS